MRLILLFSILMAASTRQTDAVPNQENPNIREACRSAVAGLYLKFHDEEQQNIHISKNITSKLSKLRKELDDSQKKWKLSKSKLESADYDPQLTRDEIRARDRVSVIRSTIEQQEQVEKKTTRRIDVLRKQKDQLRNKIEKVFLIKEKPRIVGDMYQIDIEYRSDCPKYRFICPLPEGQPQSLRDIFTNRDMPQSCARYSQVLE